MTQPTTISIERPPPKICKIESACQFDRPRDRLSDSALPCDGSFARSEG